MTGAYQNAVAVWFNARQYEKEEHWSTKVKFIELVRLLERNGYKIIKKKGSIRYYSKPVWDKLIRVDYHGSKEVPTGTCYQILKAAGIQKP